MSNKNFFRFANQTEIGKNWMDLSHTNSGSCNMGQLVPVLCEPTLPGDFFRCKLSYLARLAQMVAPPMTRIGIHFFPFFVPNRILMDNKQWDKFLGDVNQESGVSLPTMTFTPIINSMLSYFKDLVLSTTTNSLNTYLESIGYSSSVQDYFGVLNIYEDRGGIAIASDDVPIDLSVVLTKDSSNETMTVQEILDGFMRFRFWGKHPFVGTLLDYLGFPVNAPLLSSDGYITYYPSGGVIYINAYELSDVTPEVRFQVLPMLAYLFIWNEYFRQEYIQDAIDEKLLTDFNTWLSDVNNDPSILWKLKRRDWEHDYFTSCLPAPQLGQPAAVEIGEDGYFTIPELREQNALQRIAEKLLHGGSRGWEILRNFFNTSVSDARMQIPHYIQPENYATGHSWLRISDIYQTAPGTSDAFPTLDADAQIAAPRGASVNTSNTVLDFKFEAKEHGYIMILMNIQPESVYCQGMPRHFLSLDTLDYGWPDFANLSEQPVYAYELYATPENSKKNDTTDDYKIFGYMPQYSWYKFHQSELHGELRDDLDFFHFGRIFEEEPVLNSEFLECNPSDRPFPISYEYDKITYHLAFDFGVDRHLPYYGVPSLR